MAQFTKDTTLLQALESNPAVARALASYGMECASCSGAGKETLEWAAMVYGTPLDELLAKLNSTGKKK